MPNTAIVRKVTRFARILSFLLFETEDPGLGLPGGVWGKGARRRERERENHGILWGCVWDSGKEDAESELREFILQFYLLRVFYEQSGARSTASLHRMSCQGSKPGVGVSGPGRRLCPPPGKLLHNSFVFLKPFGRRAPSSGLGAAGYEVCVRVWVEKQLPFGACVGDWQVCLEPSAEQLSSLKARYFAPLWSKGLMLFSTHCPVIPDARAWGIAVRLSERVILRSGYCGVHDLLE